MGYSNVIPSWMINQILEERAKRALKHKDMKLFLVTLDGERIELPERFWTTVFPKIKKENLNG